MIGKVAYLLLSYLYSSSKDSPYPSIIYWIRKNISLKYFRSKSSSFSSLLISNENNRIRRYTQSHSLLDENDENLKKVHQNYLKYTQPSLLQLYSTIGSCGGLL